MWGVGKLMWKFKVCSVEFVGERWCVSVLMVARERLSRRRRVVRRGKRNDVFDFVCGE